METEVRDRPAELWIKVLGLVAVVTMPLIGVIGTIIIDGQKTTNVELKNLNEKMNTYNAELKTHASRISRNETDIQETNVKVNEHAQRIYQLEGRHGR